MSVLRSSARSPVFEGTTGRQDALHSHPIFIGAPLPVVGQSGLAHRRASSVCSFFVKKSCKSTRRVCSSAPAHMLQFQRGAGLCIREEGHWTPDGLLMLALGEGMWSCAVKTFTNNRTVGFIPVGDVSPNWAKTAFI